MKLMSLRFALQTTVFAVVASAGGAESAGADPTMSLGRGNAEAKIEYCMDCHGPSGQGYRGFLTMPRLAGQTTDYLESQLRAFLEGRRDRNLFIKNGNSAWPQSSNAGSFGCAFQTPQPAAIWGRSEATRRYRRSDL